MKKLVYLCLVLIMFSFIGCEKPVDPTAVSQSIVPSVLAISDSASSLNMGETLQLGFVILPSNTTDKSVTWSSSDPAIMSIDNTGLCTAISSGSVTITCTSVAKSSVTGTVIIEVIEVIPVISVSSIEITGASSGDEKQLNSESITLSATVLPENASEKSVTWTSSATDIATVTDGVVTFVSLGEFTITCTSSSDSTVSDSIDLVVVDTVVPTIELSSANLISTIEEDESVTYTAKKTVVKMKITISEIVSEFLVSDITVTGATLSGFDATDAPLYVVSVTQTDMVTPVVVSIAADVVTDAAGNGNEAASLTYTPFVFVSKEYSVYIITGQSNSLGKVFGNSTEQMPIPYDVANDADENGIDDRDEETLFYWSNVDSSNTAFDAETNKAATLIGESTDSEYDADEDGVTYMMAQQGSGSDPYFWGPEVTLSRSLVDAGENVFIIKASRGGGGSTYWSKDAFDSDAGSGHMYGHLNTVVTEGLTALTEIGHTFKLKGMYYLQGESNSQNESNAATEDVTALVANVKSIVADNFTESVSDDFKAVIGEIAATAGHLIRTTAKLKQINAANASDEIDFMLLESVDGVNTLSGDTLHYDYTAKIYMGNQIAAHYLDNVVPVVGDSGTLSYDQTIGSISFTKATDDVSDQPMLLYTLLDTDSGLTIGNSLYDVDSFSVGSLAAGTYNITVRVTDENGNSSDYAGMSITVLSIATIEFVNPSFEVIDELGTAPTMVSGNASSLMAPYGWNISSVISLNKYHGASKDGNYCYYFKSSNSYIEQSIGAASVDDIIYVSAYIARGSVNGTLVHSLDIVDSNGTVVETVSSSPSVGNVFEKFSVSHTVLTDDTYSFRVVRVSGTKLLLVDDISGTITTP